MANPNGHGGRRDNAGRKPKGRPNNQPSITSFISTARNISTNNPTSNSTRNTHTQGSSTRTTQPQTETTQNSATATGATRRNTPQRPISFTLPNHDVVDDNIREETPTEKGKRVSDSVNLREQKKAITQDAYFKKAWNLCDSGQCWDIPPAHLKNTTHGIKDCWKDFFKLPVFNWIPEALMGPGKWKPCCPNCGHKLVKNGKNKPPRLIFGQNENYWLNAPQMYKCSKCEEKRTGYLFTETHDEIMKQLPPEIFNLFPCHLSFVNGIDKKLMNLIVHTAIKGVGPVAMSECISSWHELEFQKKENQWAKHLVEKLNNQPSVNQRHIDREEIEKCPEYYSVELGGCVPSGKWLVEMFCAVVQEKRPYYDSECLKRAKASSIIAIDASYKVPKWMMKWGGERIYEALHSGTNEYNEIIFQRFSTSDNHDELGSNLESLSALGLNPYLAFSDDPARDESILKKCFSNLKNAADLEEEVEDIPEELVEMSTEKDIVYVTEIDKVTMALSKFRQDIENTINDTTSTSVKIAFDCEWPVYMVDVNGRKQKRHGDINILQLGSTCTNYTILVELYNFTNNPHHLACIGQKLRAIFSLNVSAFVGCNHKSDYTNLNKQYPCFKLPDSAKKKMDDVSLMAVNRGIVEKGNGKAGLQNLCRLQKIYLRKPANVRVGTCFASKNKSLSAEAQLYCQLDVEAPLLLHNFYEDLPDLTKRLATPPKVGQLVDIMPSQESSTKPIAQGIVVQAGGTKWTSNNVKIKKNQVLIEVRKVFNGKGIIHYPTTSTHRNKCACRCGYHGRIKPQCDFYLMSQFGKPKFQMIELISRLRDYNETVEYPPCIYETQGDSDSVGVSTTNYCRTAHVEREAQSDEAPDDVIEVPQADEEGDSQEEETEEDDDSDDTTRIEPEVLELLGENGAKEDEDQASGAYEPTPRELQRALDTSFDEKLAELIAEADRLAESQVTNESEEDNRLPVDQQPRNSKHKTVLGDAFHLMDRAKLPMHHEYKALYFRSLRAAMFIMNKDDVDDVKAVLESKPGESWEKTMAFNFGYIAARVRRTVPPPDVLYNRLRAVFDFFKDKIDSETSKPLFNTTARNKFENMLELVKQGFGSDPPNIALYVPKTNKEGRVIVDKDGLTLYRSLRGTSNLESLHQYLTTSFGHTMAGPMYSDCLLTVVKHFYNWRMSRKNRPNFPQIMHYEGNLLDRINELYLQLFGYVKHRYWSEFNENLPLQESTYGIVPINKELTSSLKFTDEDTKLLKDKPMLSYLAQRQGTALPFLPIRGVNEKKLIHQKLTEIVRSDQSLKSQTVYETIATQWNTHHISISDGIYPKLPCHFARYVKRWRKNQDRRDAEVQSGADKLSSALEYVPDMSNNEIFETVDISDTTATDPVQTENETPTASTDTRPANSTVSTDNPVQGNANTTQASVARRRRAPPSNDDDGEKQPRKKRIKHCQGLYGKPCPIPTTCDGRTWRINCVIRTKGNPALKMKRTISKNYTRTCQVCGGKMCPGSQNRSECMYA